MSLNISISSKKEVEKFLPNRNSKPIVFVRKNDTGYWNHLLQNNFKSLKPKSFHQNKTENRRVNNYNNAHEIFDLKQGKGTLTFIKEREASI